MRGLGEVDAHERILDAGPKTVAKLTAAMDAARTLIWNGPLGVFEVPPFDKATNEVAIGVARWRDGHSRHHFAHGDVVFRHELLVGFVCAGRARKRKRTDNR